MLGLGWGAWAGLHLQKNNELRCGVFWHPNFELEYKIWKKDINKLLENSTIPSKIFNSQYEKNKNKNYENQI